MTNKKTKIGSIKHQISDGFKQQLKIGQSRHKAKKENDTSGVFSYQTLHTYTQQMINFASWVKDTHGVKNVAKMEPYIDDYIKQLISDGKSAYTQATSLCAISKYYGKDYIKTVEHERRERQQIKRGRNGIHYSFSERKNADLVLFCKHTGLRRSELLNLKGGDIATDGEHWFIDVKQGKGGKHRYVPILNDNDEVIKIMTSKSPKERVFPKIHSHAPIHKYRADYAQAMYDSIARDINSLPKNEIYSCRKDKKGIWYDKKAMLRVSQALGHNRISVIADHYLNDIQ